MARIANKHSHIQDFSLRLQKLVTDRRAWQAGYDASNNTLYQILGKCLDIVSEARANEVAQHDLKAALEANGYKLTERTTLEARVVKCVFDADRRRTSVYSIVLQIASKSRITGQDLPKWIKQHGGVEEIRLKKAAKDAVPRKDLVALAEQGITSARVSGTLVDIPGSWELTDSDKSPISVAVLKRLPDGRRMMVWAVSDNALSTAAMARYGRVLHQSQRNAQESTRLRTRSKKRAEIAAKARPINQTSLKIPPRRAVKKNRPATKVA